MQFIFRHDWIVNDYGVYRKNELAARAPRATSYYWALATSAARRRRAIRWRQCVSAHASCARSSLRCWSPLDVYACDPALKVVVIVYRGARVESVFACCNRSSVASSAPSSCAKSTLLRLQAAAVMPPPTLWHVSSFSHASTSSCFGYHDCTCSTTLMFCCTAVAVKQCDVLK